MRPYTFAGDTEPVDLDQVTEFSCDVTKVPVLKLLLGAACKESADPVEMMRVIAIVLDRAARQATGPGPKATKLEELSMHGKSLRSNFGEDTDYDSSEY